MIRDGGQDGGRRFTPSSPSYADSV
jgi:hypothetical protein